MTKYLHYEEAEVQEEIAKILEDKKIVQPEGLDFFGITNKETEEKEQ